ncbi:hypothetical protein FRC06_004558 [Ceratobasidium sp. 370]|nr:hypothetical protein FRC06_004558 [Ceratobasidium sp. 370]
MSPRNRNSLLSRPVKAGIHTLRSYPFARYIRSRNLPSLITSADTVSHAESIQAESFQLLSEKHTDMAVVCSPPRPKHAITVQRLGMQTPSPPWAVRYMSTRGGGRFSLMSRMEFHRPASERLAAQDMEGEFPNAVPQETHTGHTLDTRFAPEQLKVVKRLVAARISRRHLKTMAPLKQALHNALARAMVLKVLTGVSIRPKRHLRNSGIGFAKSEGEQRMRRTRPTVAPLNMDAVHACGSANPLTDSPPDSPGPHTPTDDIDATREGSGEADTSGEKTVAPSKSKAEGRR